MPTLKQHHTTLLNGSETNMCVVNLNDALLGLNIDIGAATALVALSSHNLIVVSSKVESESSPGVEVVLHGDGTTDTLALADRPVLLEGACAIDRRLVCASRDVDVVIAAVSRERTLVLSTAAGVVGTKRFNHVVFDEGRSSPTVDSKVAITLGVEASTIVDGAWMVSEVFVVEENICSLALTGQCQGSSPFHQQSCQYSATGQSIDFPRPG